LPKCRLSRPMRDIFPMHREDIKRTTVRIEGLTPRILRIRTEPVRLGPRIARSAGRNAGRCSRSLLDRPVKRPLTAWDGAQLRAEDSRGDFWIVGGHVLTACSRSHGTRHVPQTDRKNALAGRMSLGLSRGFAIEDWGKECLHVSFGARLP